MQARKTMLSNSQVLKLLTIIKNVKKFSGNVDQLKSQNIPKNVMYSTTLF